MPTRSVFITGAAAGIGRHTALTFARKGYVIGAYDIDEAGLASLVDEVKAAGSRAVTGHLDVTDADEFATRLDEFADSNGGRLDVLINNAGILLAGPFEEIPLATQHLAIVQSQAGDRAAVLGATIMVAREVLSPASVDGYVAAKAR